MPIHPRHWCIRRLITQDLPIFNADARFNAGVWAVSNTAGGRSLLGEWLGLYTADAWSNDEGRWACKTRAVDGKRQCEWAGEMFEQGAFLNHMLSRYHGQIRQTPWTVLNSPCVTGEDLRAATVCHFSTYLRPLALLFLRGDVAVGGRGARAVRPVLWHDLEPLTLTQQLAPPALDEWKRLHWALTELKYFCLAEWKTQFGFPSTSAGGYADSSCSVSPPPQAALVETTPATTPAAAIPKLLWQTTHLDLARVPFHSLLGDHAAGYERTVADDAACEAFIAEHFPRAVGAYRALKGAHKADLWRYCVLYVHGGVYLDIKTVLHQPLDVLFPSRNDKLTWFAVVCNNTKCGNHTHIYNGILASPPENPIFLRLIDYVIAHAPPSKYHAYVDDMKRAIDARYGAYVQGYAVLEDAATRVILRTEVCSDKECKHTPKRAKDRYGHCCNVYDRTIDPRSPVITVRDADYPWDGSVQKQRGTTDEKLAKAVSLGDAGAAIRLLAAGASANGVTSNGWPLLAVAAQKGRTGVAAALLEHGADADGGGDSGFTPLMLAAGAGHVQVVGSLLAHSAYTSAAAEYGSRRVHGPPPCGRVRPR